MTTKVFAREASRSALLAAAALTGGLALSISLLPSSARAEDGDGPSMLGSMMQFVGLAPSKDTAAPKIDYRERPPLVLPKAMDLPPPQPRAAARDPAWPHDPDVEKANRAAALERAPAVQPGQDTAMSNEELMQRRDIANTPGGPAACGEFSGETCDPHQTWAALRIKKGDPGTGTEAEAIYAPGKEPPRKYLTQPPPGYLTPTKIVKPTIAKKRDPDADDNPNEYYNNQTKERHSVDD